MGKFWKISSERADEASHLFSNQEETDPRLILYTEHAEQEGHEAMLITTQDTEVFLLLLGFSTSGRKLYMKYGTKTRSK